MPGWVPRAVDQGGGRGVWAAAAGETAGMERRDADGVVCSFTGIGPAQSKALVEKAQVYLTANGRISMGGLNSHNIRYFAESLDKAVRGQL